MIEPNIIILGFYFNFIFIIDYVNKKIYFYTGAIMATIKDTNSLKYLMNEVISEKRMTQKLNSNTIKFTSLDESVIESLLNSDVFSVRESKAIRILFSKTKTKTLTD